MELRAQLPRCARAFADRNRVPEECVVVVGFGPRAKHVPTPVLSSGASRGGIHVWRISPSAVGLSHLVSTVTASLRHARVGIPCRDRERDGKSQWHVDCTSVAQESETNIMGELIDKTKGKIKQAAGKASGNDKMHAEGVADEVKGKVKGAFEEVKQTVKDVAKPKAPKR
jgi:uncharacterized protein YjbJ (UPF0337 family)